MLRMPIPGHPARESVQAAMPILALLGDREQVCKLPGLIHAKGNARRAMAVDRTIRSIETLVLRADGELHLMRFGPRGGKTNLWNFGKL